jgi:hypothetical protein
MSVFYNRHILYLAVALMNFHEFTCTAKLPYFTLLIQPAGAFAKNGLPSAVIFMKNAYLEQDFDICKWYFFNVGCEDWATSTRVLLGSSISELTHR